MPDHKPSLVYQVRHPGGKNGYWRAGCSCGYVSGFYPVARYAEIARDQHIKAKVTEHA